MSPNLADYQGVKVLNEEALFRVRHNSGVAAEIRRGAPTFGTQASVWLSASGREAEGGTERTEGQTEAVATAISPSRSSRQEHGDFFIRSPSAIAMNDQTVQQHAESPGRAGFAALASELPALPKREDPLPDAQEAFVASKTVPFEDAAQ